jgi:uncharacterized protein (DUF1330 family)
MKCYFLVESEVADQSWVADYLKNVTPMVERRGGRYLARTSKVQRLEGERKLLPVFIIIEWPSEAVAKEFYNSEEYKPYRQARIAGSKNEFLLIAGEDIANDELPTD